MRVLVVEDDTSLSADLQRVLGAEGFECEAAADGGQGFAMAQAGAYDLVILDILLPTKNGFQICADLRADGCSVPILMLTAKVGDWDEAESLDTGADDYLTKPFSMVVLLAHIRALIRRSRMFARDVFSFDGVTLDPVRHVCRTPASQVQLSGREVEVLACLMVAEGSIVDKDDLVVGIWGSDFQGNRNIVEVYIRHLRRKLEPIFGRKIIDTAHGSGYRFHTQGST
jgi:DNA-binding response OmpR family regulator